MKPSTLKVIEKPRRCGKTFAMDITARTERLAARLAANVTRRALAEEIASHEIVRAVMDGRSDVQVEADIMARLSKHEEVCALRQAGRRNQERTKS